MDRLIDIGEEEMWTDFLEEVNKLLHEEKAARHENDAVKLSQIWCRIVSMTPSHNLDGNGLWPERVQVDEGVHAFAVQA